MSEHPILTAEHLTRRFGEGTAEVVAVRDVDLALRRGELALIMGPSGSGKTTLLSMLGALLRPTAGKVTIDDVEVTALAESRLPDLRDRVLGIRVDRAWQSFHRFADEVASRARAELGVRDVVIFDPETVADRATWEEPRLEPVGIDRVIVNGQVVAADGAPTGALPGRVLRR